MFCYFVWHCRIQTSTDWLGYLTIFLDIKLKTSDKAFILSHYRLVDWLESNKSCWKCNKKEHYSKNNNSLICMTTYTFRSLANFSC